MPLKGNPTEEARELLNKVVELCLEYGFSLSHQDDQGAFRVVPYSKTNERWLLASHIEVDDDKNR